MNRGRVIGIIIIVIGAFFLFAGIFNIISQQESGTLGLLRPSELMAYTMTILGLILTIIGTTITYIKK